MYIEECGLIRYKNNPVIKPEDFSGALATFNCAPVRFNNKYLLLLPIQLKGSNYPEIHIAESDNGIDFSIRKEPFITKSKTPGIAELDDWPIDPRVTYIKEDDMYYIIRPLTTDSFGTSSLLGRTKDFVTYEEMSIIALPENRVPCLFPEKINGKYMRFDRPTYGASGRAGIWVSYSNDLIHWGEYRHFLAPWTDWGKMKIGPTPPIKTKYGWLEIIHGVKPSHQRRYSLGAVLMDLNDPTKIIGKANSPILTPTMPYEYMGHVPNVVFACGALADEENDELRIYYGAADTCIGLAIGKLSEIAEMCILGK